MTLCGQTCASTEARPRDPKMRLINVVFLRTLSEIKLKRTDTTLDLSQKAKRAGEEKKKRVNGGGRRAVFKSARGWPVRALVTSVHIAGCKREVTQRVSPTAIGGRGATLIAYRNGSSDSHGKREVAPLTKLIRAPSVIANPTRQPFRFSFFSKRRILTSLRQLPIPSTPPSNLPFQSQWLPLFLYVSNPQTALLFPLERLV